MECEILYQPVRTRSWLFFFTSKLFSFIKNLVTIVSPCILWKNNKKAANENSILFRKICLNSNPYNFAKSTLEKKKTFLTPWISTSKNCSVLFTFVTTSDLFWMKNYQPPTLLSYSNKLLCNCSKYVWYPFNIRFIWIFFHPRYSTVFPNTSFETLKMGSWL